MMPKTISRAEERALRAVLTDARERARTLGRQVATIEARLGLEHGDERVQAAVFSDYLPFDELLRRVVVKVVDGAGQGCPAADPEEI